MEIKRKLKGFTLIELLIVLGIVAVISAGMYAVYNNVSLSQKSTQEINNLNILKGGIENLFATSADYTGLDQSIIAKSSIPTAPMIKGDTIINSWGEEYVIKAEVSGASSANFSIETTVPQKACEKVINALSGTWSGITLNGNIKIKERGDASSYNTIQMIKDCNEAADPVKILVYDNDSK